jgi:hypothetical protein
VNNNRQTICCSLVFAAAILLALVVLGGTSGCDAFNECNFFNAFCGAGL